MPVPRVTAVRDAIVTRLQTITIANGYTHDIDPAHVKTIRRLPKTIRDVADREIQVTWLRKLRDNTQEPAIGSTIDEAEYLVTTYFKTTDRDDIAEMLADQEQALLARPDNYWLGLGTWATKVDCPAVDLWSPTSESLRGRMIYGNVVVRVTIENNNQRSPWVS